MSIIREKPNIMELKLKIDKKAILKKYQDAFGAWVTFMFLFPALLITIMIVAPGFPVIVPVIGGIISVLTSRKNWKLYQVFKDLNKLPEIIPATEFLNMLRSVQIGYDLTWEEIQAEGETQYSINFYRWELVVDEEGIETYEKRPLLSSLIRYNGTFSLKGIIPFIEILDKIPEEYSREKLLLFYAMD